MQRMIWFRGMLVELAEISSRDFSRELTIKRRGSILDAKKTSFKSFNRNIFRAR